MITASSDQLLKSIHRIRIQTKWSDILASELPGERWWVLIEFGDQKEEKMRVRERGGLQLTQLAIVILAARVMLRVPSTMIAPFTWLIAQSFFCVNWRRWLLKISAFSFSAALILGQKSCQGFFLVGLTGARFVFYTYTKENDMIELTGVVVPSHVGRNINL